MSSLALTSTSVSSEVPLDPRAHWITPKEQLERLKLFIAKEVSRIVPSLIVDLGKIVAEYALEECLTNWYTAHDRLGSLPKKVPPLENIYQIMYSPCPIYRGKLKPDGEPYLVKDTHFLSLVSEELGSLNKMEKDILRPYGERTYSKEENPLQFRFFLNRVRQQHADVPVSDTYFIMMTMGVLPGSRNKPWKEQVALVNTLNQKLVISYTIPTLQQSFIAITTDMVATGERRYQFGDDQNQGVDTYTRVEETETTYSERRLLVGGFAPRGIGVLSSADYPTEHIGVAVLRKL